MEDREKWEGEEAWEPVEPCSSIAVRSPLIMLRSLPTKRSQGEAHRVRLAVAVDWAEQEGDREELTAGAAGDIADQEIRWEEPEA